jgi:hypothetical protein
MCNELQLSKTWAFSATVAAFFLTQNSNQKNGTEKMTTNLSLRGYLSLIANKNS